MIELVSIPLWFDYNFEPGQFIELRSTGESQFHYGSITTVKNHIHQTTCCSSLNSTMVRLQQKLNQKTYKNRRESQFHYGSITTRAWPARWQRPAARSQFHYGSITTMRIKFTIFSVRKSQFHYGSITTKNYLSSLTTILRLVSIPLWFDYNCIRRIVYTR